jgi:hypothetical protein
VDCGLGGDDFGLDGLPMRPGVCAVCVACGRCGSLISSSASSRRGRVLTGRPGPFDPAGSAGVGSLFLGSRTPEDPGRHAQVAQHSETDFLNHEIASETVCRLDDDRADAASCSSDGSRS